MQRRTCSERGTRRGERVGDIHPGRATEGRRQQVRPCQRHGTTALFQHDHLAPVGGLQHDGPRTPAALLVDEVPDPAPGRLHREPDDGARAPAAHRPHQRVVGVEHGIPVTRNRFHDHGFHPRQLLERVDAVHSEVIGRDVGDDRDVVAVVPQTFAEYAAARDLEHREVDPRILQHHAR